MEELSADSSSRTSISSRVSAQREHIDYQRFKRPAWSTSAMSTNRRRQMTFKRLLMCFCGPDNDSTTTNQYRIPPRCSEATKLINLSSTVDSLAIKFTLWIYRTSFAKAILGFFLLVLIIIHFFALLIWCFALLYYKGYADACLAGWRLLPSPFSFSHNYVVSFAVSWQTFVTVGYGVIAPPDDVSSLINTHVLTLHVIAVSLLTSKYANSTCRRAVS